ncbi:serine/threonine protein kinase [Anaerovibrio lipolyticus]|uniref:serine/threonine protein kinase n=1 Tax=Anaerovibrio lipolyticus TaxID=82374 RepID=UPI001F409E9F|nr:serine/threonine-protein kinase [Anaerovibrio lipolyticus]MCF2602010.1 serine/threonine protein kinase [Anaerovibrio lipolyticus]
MKDFATEFILNKYQRLQLLHNSPKGKVWRSIDQDSNQKVILRELSRFNPVYEELKKYNFSICPEIYFYTQGESSSTVIEQYIEGSTLADLLAQNYEFSPQQIQQMLSRLCHGLKELHECGIIHRDIKPANLILQNPELPESLYLIDFDAARLLSGHKATDTALLGTRGYAPPEQYGFSQTDARSDIYALGCTFKEILGPQYHGRLIPILNKCCAIDPQARYQNVDKLLKALNRPPIFQCLAQHKRNILALGMAVGMTAICFTAYINYTKTEPAPAIPKHETTESQTETTLPSSDEAAPQVKDTTAPSTLSPATVPKQSVSKPAQNIIYPQYYANGNPLLSHEDGVYLPSTSSRVTISNQELQASGGHFPGNTPISISITNPTAANLESPVLSITYNDTAGISHNSLQLPTIAPGDSAQISLPMEEFACQEPLSLVVNISSPSPQRIFAKEMLIVFDIQ